ncbi:lectin-like protein [Heliothis virescens ascovirus 3j]|uniref:Lectin-like protein n=1 Tax=Heliothis virescens ascovirus 3j TaxID=1561067 RepID=A0A2Z5UZI6_9VIRU|nr:lectin-like protein [Heliothis virescens ascovirus 3j]
MDKPNCNNIEHADFLSYYLDRVNEFGCRVDALVSSAMRTEAGLERLMDRVRRVRTEHMRNISPSRSIPSLIRALDATSLND